MKQGYLILETGEVFEGVLSGEISVETGGEVVFNTSMSGYQEIITDPSYAGQIIVFTYPLIGNYGVSVEDDESAALHLRGIVTGELSPDRHHHRATGSVQGRMDENGLPYLTGIDTRRLVRIIRKKGTVRGIISERKDAAVQAGEDGAMYDRVTTKKVITYGNRGPHVVLLDFGYKKSILDYLLEQLGVQAMGITVSAGYAFAVSFLLLLGMKAVMKGLRVTEEQELAGLDISEHGSYGYPEAFNRDDSDSVLPRHLLNAQLLKE